MSTEAFPPLSTGASAAGAADSSLRPRPRRTRSSLGADPRGDTGAGSLATAYNQRAVDEPVSPVDRKSSEKASRQRKRRKAGKILSRWKRISLKHTWVNPLALLVVLLSAYFVRPGEQNPLHRAIFLSYANPPLNERTTTLPLHIGPVTQYGKGPRDFAFVAFYTVVFTFTREFFMQRVIRPLAISCGIHSRAKQSRFMEQMYTAMYFGIFGPFGLFVMSRTPVWYFNTTGMYEGFPHRAHEAYFKAYYLLQASYWAQQGLVLLLQLEKPRKDFKELVLHHIITLALIGLSYRFHFTYMGIAVYVTHDISDFFLATSKSLNYIDSAFTIPYFATFIGVWAYMRHYLNLAILVSLLPPSVGDRLQQLIPSAHIQTGQFVTIGPFDLNWDTQQYKCSLSQVITFGLLAALQAVNMFWFFLIIRILLRYLYKGVQKDDRSDDEEEDEDVPADDPIDVKADAGAPDEKSALKKPEVLVNGRPLPDQKS